MRKRLFWVAWSALAVLLVGDAPALADSYSFSLLPSSGEIQGAAGSLIGWGYSITNNSSTDYLDPLAVNAGIFQFATLDSGDYFDFPLIAPNSTATMSFTPAGLSGFGTGLAALTFSSVAPPGFTDIGRFDLSACFSNGAGTCVQSAPDLFVSYSATVTQTPEPSGRAMILLTSILFLTMGFTARAREAARKPAPPATS